MPISTIENQGPKNFIVWKYPDSRISLGSQVIVNESEEALLFEGGQLLQILQPGRHLVESGNIPGLESIISSSFKNKSPIIVEIWFVNKVASFDYKWGTNLQMRDNSHGLIFPLRAHGSYALRIDDPASFIIQLVGKSPALTDQELRPKLFPLIMRNLKDHVAETLVKEDSDIFTITTQLREISSQVKTLISKEFERFGLELIDFYVMGLDVDETDQNYKRLKETLAEAASTRLKAKAEADSLRVRAQAASESQGFYQTERSYDALQKAAENEGGLAGSLLSGGLGLGLGVGAGQQMGNAINQNTKLTNNLDATNSSDQTDISEKLLKLKQLLDSGLISKSDYESKKSQLLDMM